MALRMYAMYAVRQVSSNQYRRRTTSFLEIDDLRVRSSQRQTLLREWGSNTFGNCNISRLDRLLFIFEQHKSTDFRDRVYALLGLAECGYMIKVDYTVDRETLAERVVRFCQRTREYSDTNPIPQIT